MLLVAGFGCRQALEAVEEMQPTTAQFCEMREVDGTATLVAAALDEVARKILRDTQDFARHYQVVEKVRRTHHADVVSDKNEEESKFRKQSDTVLTSRVAGEKLPGHDRQHQYRYQSRRHAPEWTSPHIISQ